MEAKTLDVSVTKLAEGYALLGRVEMYRDVLAHAVRWRDCLPPTYCQELISMDPQSAKTQSSDPL
jgi:hypothetical protein